MDDQSSECVVGCKVSVFTAAQILEQRRLFKLLVVVYRLHLYNLFSIVLKLLSVVGSILTNMNTVMTNGYYKLKREMNK